MSESDEQRPVRIWSGEHEAYWREGGCGYTTHAPVAWVLSEYEARRQTAHCGPEKKIVIEPATDRADDLASLATVTRERDEVMAALREIALLPAKDVSARAPAIAMHALNWSEVPE